MTSSDTRTNNAHEQLLNQYLKLTERLRQFAGMTVYENPEESFRQEAALLDEQDAILARAVALPLTSIDEAETALCLWKAESTASEYAGLTSTRVVLHVQKYLAEQVKL